MAVYTTMAMTYTVILTSIVASSAAAILGMNYIAMNLATKQMSDHMAESGLHEGAAFVWSKFDAENNYWIYDSDANVYTKEQVIKPNLGTVTITVSPGPPINIKATATLTRFGVIRNRESTLIVTMNAITNLTPGLIGIKKVEAGGSGKIDSYNSEDPYKSTAGLYDPLKASDEAFLASVDSSSSFSIGGRLIHGYVGAPTGVGISMNKTASVGDTAWVSDPANAGKIQPGHLLRDYNEQFPEITPDFVGPSPTSGSIDGVTYTYVLDSGDYTMTKLSLGSTHIMLIKGKVRLHVQESITVGSSAAIALEKGASLELYCPGDITLGGQGAINANGIPKMLKIFGYNVSSNSKIDIAGSSEFYGSVYAPGKRVNLAGTAQFFGGVVGDSIKIGGEHDVHFDEALGTKASTEYEVSSWKEL